MNSEPSSKKRKLDFSDDESSKRNKKEIHIVEYDYRNIRDNILKSVIDNAFTECFGLSKKLFSSMRKMFKIIALKKESEILSICAIHISNEDMEVLYLCTPENKRKRGYARRILEYLIKYATDRSLKLWLMITKEEDIDMFTRFKFLNPQIVSKIYPGLNFELNEVRLYYSPNGSEKEIKESAQSARNLIDELWNSKKIMLKEPISRHIGFTRTLKFKIDDFLLKEVYFKLLLQQIEYGGPLYVVNGLLMTDFKKILKGNPVEEEGRFAVNLPCNEYNTFHTHPAHAYYHYGNLMGPVSNGDLAFALRCSNRDNFHVVFTLEGIYTYQVNPNFVKLIIENKSYNNTANDLLILWLKDQMSFIGNFYDKKYKKLFLKYHKAETVEESLNLINRPDIRELYYSIVFEQLNAFSNITLNNLPDKMGIGKRVPDEINKKNYELVGINLNTPPEEVRKIVQKLGIKEDNLMLVSRYFPSKKDPNKKFEEPLFYIDYIPNVWNHVKNGKPVYIYKEILRES